MKGVVADTGPEWWGDTSREARWPDVPGWLCLDRSDTCAWRWKVSLGEKSA